MPRILPTRYYCPRVRPSASSFTLAFLFLCFQPVCSLSLTALGPTATTRVVQVFKLLKGYKKRCAVISASFFLEGKPQEFRDETGLVSGHAYSVLQARPPSLALPRPPLLPSTGLLALTAHGVTLHCHECGDR